MIPKKDARKIIKTALLAGKILLKNGAETYRVEETMERICQAGGLHDINSFVTPTGLFIAAEDEEDLTLLKRIKKRTINLNKIAQVSNFSREFAQHQIPIDAACEKLQMIEKEDSYAYQIKILFASFSAGCFVILLQGNWAEFILSFFITGISMLLFTHLKKLIQAPFMNNIVSVATIAFLALLCAHLGLTEHKDSIIAASIMPFLPGLALTNGLRDLISGDLIAGMTRLAEAFLLATSIAMGIAATLEIWRFIFGGAL